MKKCTKCKQEKNIDEFGTVNTKRNATCKECRNTEAKLYRRKKGLKIGVIVKSPKRKNINAASKICTKCLTLKEIDSFSLDKNSSDKRSAACNKCRAIDAKRYRKENIEAVKITESNRDREKRNIRQKEYGKTEKGKEVRNNRQRRQYKSNPYFIARHRCHSLLFRTLKATNMEKDSATYKLLGYTPQQLKKSIESKFLAGMNWVNRGKWHIDHIKPISRFIKEGITDPAIINALDNLEPLWAFDNLSKGAKYDNA